LCYGQQYPFNHKHGHFHGHYQLEFEDTKGVIRIRKFLKTQHTKTCQKYSVTVIFYYIFHIKLQFLKTLFQSQFLFDFDEIFTNRSENVRSFLWLFFGSTDFKCSWFKHFHGHYQLEFEDTKGVIRIRKSKKDRQHNGQKKNQKGQTPIYKRCT
jgi:hypothetical protein